VPREELQPYALVAPYFYMTETTYKQWLPVATRAIALAKEHYPNARIFASFVVSQGIILNSALAREIVDAFNAEGPEGYLLWVDNLDENQAGGAELSGLVTVARRLRSKKEREVVNLHGGYFSVLAAGVLGDSAMSGVTHGPEFGESRSVVPVAEAFPLRVTTFLCFMLGFVIGTP